MDYKKRYDPTKKFEKLGDIMVESGEVLHEFRPMKIPTPKEKKEWEEKQTAPEGPSGYPSRKPFDTYYPGRTPFNVLSELNVQSYVPLDVLHERMKLDMRTWEEYDDFTRDPGEPTRIIPGSRKEEWNPISENIPRQRESKVIQKMAHGRGGRKSCTAIATITPGIGRFTIRGRKLVSYFPFNRDRIKCLQPLAMTETLGKFNVSITVHGGGTTGQSEAVRAAVAHALQAWDPHHRAVLKVCGFITRDERIVERKKPGQAKARKKFQWSKR